MPTTTLRRLAVTAVAVAIAAPAAAALAAPSVPTTSGRTAADVAPAQLTSSSLTSSSLTATSGTYCGITWGSLPKVRTPLWTGRVTAARWGRHACWDRLVLDVAKGAGSLGYRVRYVSTVTSPGSGLPVAVSGGAKLQITVNAPATTRIPPAGAVTFSGWQTFRQLKWVGSFEGYTDFGLGVRARLPMRSFVLTNTDGSKRLVVDVAHAW